MKKILLIMCLLAPYTAFAIDILGIVALSLSGACGGCLVLGGIVKQRGFQTCDRCGERFGECLGDCIESHCQCCQQNYSSVHSEMTPLVAVQPPFQVIISQPTTPVQPFVRPTPIRPTPAPGQELVQAMRFQVLVGASGSKEVASSPLST